MKLPISEAAEEHLFQLAMRAIDDERWDDVAKYTNALIDLMKRNADERRQRRLAS